MAKNDLLNFLKDINYVYNDCGMYDSVSKMLEDFESEIRAKAIDEFAEKLKDFIAKQVEDAESSNDLCTEIFQSEIDEIAEQLKEE